MAQTLRANERGQKGGLPRVPGIHPPEPRPTAGGASGPTPQPDSTTCFLKSQPSLDVNRTQSLTCKSQNVQHSPNAADEEDREEAYCCWGEGHRPQPTATQRPKEPGKGAPAAAQWTRWCLGSTGTQVRSLAPAQWLKDPALPQLWLRSRLQLGSDAWPGSSKNGRKKKRTCQRHPQVYPPRSKREELTFCKGTKT